MPRRQRFKPSRKPKPIINEETQTQQTSNLGAIESEPRKESLPVEPENAAK